MSLETGSFRKHGVGLHAGNLQDDARYVLEINPMQEAN